MTTSIIQNNNDIKKIKSLINESKISYNDKKMIELLQFFKQKNNARLLRSIINQENNISLRLIDWFVTNYAKKNNIYYYIKDDNTKEDILFFVYIQYKNKLKNNSKKKFDPFRRGKRINIIDFDNVTIQTTIGQLNFFKWAIENGIINYIAKHFNEIEEDMNQCCSILYSKKYKAEHKNEVDENNRKKRQELSICATKNVSHHNIKIIVDFDA